MLDRCPFSVPTTVIRSVIDSLSRSPDRFRFTRVPTVTAVRGLRLALQRVKLPRAARVASEAMG